MTHKLHAPKLGAFGNPKTREDALTAFGRRDVAALTGKSPGPPQNSETHARKDEPQPKTGNPIVPILNPDGKPLRVGYLGARTLAAVLRGQLPSNVLHDDLLVKLWDKLPEAEKVKLFKYYDAWARELVVHPAKDGEFISGQDIVDSRTGWILPWSEVVKLIPASELSGTKKGLFLDPRDIVEERGKIIVLPKSIVLLHPFIQTSGSSGKVHEATRIPLEITPQTKEERRALFRNDTVRISLATRANMSDNSRWCVQLGHMPSYLLGVAVERLQFPASSTPPVSSLGSPVLGSQVPGLGTALPDLSPVPRVK